MNIIFFGTNEFAAGILQALIDSADFVIDAVVTAPDRPAGRHQEIKKPAVKILAEKHGLRVDQPESLNNFDLTPYTYDLGIVCDYGLIIPDSILNFPRHGSINIHPSLLPKYRGASPIQSALLNGEIMTGVSIIMMDEKLDHGPILAQNEVKITPTDDYASLAQKLQETAKFLLVDTARRWVNGPKMTPVAQDDARAVYCREFTRADGQAHFSVDTAFQIYNRFRALGQWPGIWTFWGGKRVKLLELSIAHKAIIDNIEIWPSGMAKIFDGRLYVRCSENSLVEITKLQMEGKKPIEINMFINGYKSLTDVPLV
ncbi:MAG: methionyl-tRNA formyltransferase [Candidatus Magasanikbacteria bacterium]|jgi:methionyl-tRNA formyltransferase